MLLHVTSAQDDPTVSLFFCRIAKQLAVMLSKRQEIAKTKVEGAGDVARLVVRQKKVPLVSKLGNEFVGNLWLSAPEFFPQELALPACKSTSNSSRE